MSGKPVFRSDTDVTSPPTVEALETIIRAARCAQCDKECLACTIGALHYPGTNQHQMTDWQRNETVLVECGSEESTRLAIGEVEWKERIEESKKSAPPQDPMLHPYPGAVVHTEANKKQIGGQHYGLGARQHWDLVVEFGWDYFQGQIIKYVMRHKGKHGIQDLKKAAHFLEKYIEVLEKQEQSPKD